MTTTFIKKKFIEEYKELCLRYGLRISMSPYAMLSPADDVEINQMIEFLERHNT